MNRTLLGTPLVIAACASGAAHYPAREPGCPVRTFAGEPTLEVDDLGPIAVDCGTGAKSCERQLLDAVCAAGGDVASALGNNPIGASHLSARAAHSKRVTKGPREPGCAVRVFEEGPTVPTENIGPVRSFCSPDDSREVCLRELEDQVCRLGGDVLWQVEGPLPDGDRQEMTGRAAHLRP